MPLSAGTRIGPYEVVSQLGVGGMGEVYRARDAKLNREVALKVLPPSVADEPERLARFRREAQVLASLNHPNIAHIHGFEDGDGTHALVMEVVEGLTLAERIDQGPIPIADALPIARQIAEALESAHEQGIIHRDLKPANVKVRDDGAVKVLDFGLAKAMSADSGPGAQDTSNSPTLTARATQLGVILGTAAYMAPEQAKGRPVDRRADIWAFGVVLFEMVSGRRGYEAEDISETLAAVLTREVDWTMLPSSTPARLKALIKDCLVRDPRQRLRDIGDARRVLEAMIAGEPEEAASLPAAVVEVPVWRRALPWAVAAAAIAVAAFATVHSFNTVASPSVVTRSETLLDSLSLFPSVSVDGTRIAYASFGAAKPGIMLRMADQFEAKALPDTDDGAFPIFSPDGQWIAYSTLMTGKIKKISITGGAATTIADGDFSQGATWSAGGTIVFGGSKGLKQVAAEGGTPTALTTVDSEKKETAHVRPQFLPDERHVLFTVLSADPSSPSMFEILDLADGSRREVAKGGSNGRYVASGHLTHVRDSTLFALPFDLENMTVTGVEVPVVEGVSTLGPEGSANYAVSDGGLLVYFATDADSEGTVLGWADRTGKQEVLPGQSQRKWGAGRLSPDGRFVADEIDSGTKDIWVFDVRRGIANRVTSDGGSTNAIWTWDSKHVIFSSTRDGQHGISKVPADGSGQPVLILKTDVAVVPTSISPDGRTLLFTQNNRIMRAALSEAGEADAPQPLHDTSSPESDGQISPDGRWVVYGSMEAGVPEIYAHAFPGGGAKVRISTEGGIRPRWARTGKAILYWSPGTTMALTSVDVSVGETMEPGPPTTLFQMLAGTTWDVTPDPDRFLVETTPALDETWFAMITNWFEELRRKAPARQ